MCAVMWVQDLPCRLSFCTGNSCNPKEMEISVTGQALTREQIELKSLTSESWTEPLKWKSFLNVHKIISCVPLPICTDWHRSYPAVVATPIFLLPLGGWRVELWLFEEGRAE
jgi:hypothetical protein